MKLRKIKNYLFLHKITVQGKGVFISKILNFLVTSCAISLELQLFKCPGVLPRLKIYLPLQKFRILQIGSFGTLIIAYLFVNSLSLFIARLYLSMCSRTSRHKTKSIFFNLLCLNISSSKNAISGLFFFEKRTLSLSLSIPYIL